MKFFDGYNNIRCNYEEFQLIKHYLNDDGWTWLKENRTPLGEWNEESLLSYCPSDLALVSVSREAKKLNPYYLDEIHYIIPDKDAKEIIREIKLHELGI
jgi:hypothetical protein